MYPKKLSFLILCLGFIHFGFSQETSSILNGTISTDKKDLLSGSVIELVHVPTGYKTRVQSNSKGIFVIPNLKPGGPYQLTISFMGYKKQEINDLYLGLGDNPALNIIMYPDSQQLTEVTIVGGKKQNMAGLNINQRQLAAMPSIGRSLGDFTRLTPQSNNNSFAGSNFRYNNLTLDGAINNDAIGFSNSFGGVSGGGQSGAAGSGTRTVPYSIDAIQEVQVQLAPFDVKLGNFTGGSVNAVTKSGTNEFHGSAYMYGRNQALVGKSVDGNKTKIGSDFHENQYGASIGGPIIKNKLFFFVNAEQTRRQEPTFYNPGDPGAAITVDEAQKIYNKLQSEGYDAGSYNGAYKIFTNSDKLFGRLDFNIGKKNTLMLRGLYTNGWGNNLERSSTNFQFGSSDFTQHTKNLNLVAELKSKLGNDLNNQLILSYINVHEYRDFPGTVGPFMDIDNGRIYVGTWREAAIYNMHQKTYEFTDNLTYQRGINKFTLGTHNEFYDLSYGFVNSWNGRWEYSRGVESFIDDNPSRIRGAFTIDPKIPNDRQYLFDNPPSPYKVALLSGYFQDEIAIYHNLKITPGIRVDYSKVKDQPYLDPAVTATNPGYVPANPTYTNTPFNQLTNQWLGKATISPRIGFNFNVLGDQSFVLRGGTGIFVGRMPFAWLGYAYTLTGETYGNIDWNQIPAGKQVPLAVDPQGLKDTVTKYGGVAKSSTHEVDLIDNGFKLPTVWRSNLAADFKFDNGIKLTLDALFTKTIYDVKFQQINLKDSVQYFTSGPTQTPVYVGGKYNPVFSNAFFLTNTREGYRYNLTAQISQNKPARNWGKHSVTTSWSLAYTYGMSKDVANGIRNSFQSNYEVNPAITPNSPTLAYSNFDLRHRIVGTIGTSVAWTPRQITSLNLYYESRSGSPYTLVYQSAPFGNGSNASLPYIPKDQSDIRLADYTLNGVVYTAAQQWNDLNNLISSDKYLNSRRGEYAERNAMRTPWYHGIDLRLMHEFRLSKTNNRHSLQASLDILNFLNLLNNNWGHLNFVTNINNYDVNFLKFAKDANGKNPGTPASGYEPTFNFVKPTGINGNYYTLDPINSRWQAQLGLKYNF